MAPGQGDHGSSDLRAEGGPDLRYNGHLVRVKDESIERLYMKLTKPFS